MKLKQLKCFEGKKHEIEHTCNIVFFLIYDDVGSFGWTLQEATAAVSSDKVGRKIKEIA
jgi:hypothetical protein